MIRYTPTLTFELDTSIEHGVRLTQLIDSLKKPEGSAVGTAGVGAPAQASDAGSDEHDHIIDEG
jgi:hypothetical protein